MDNTVGDMVTSMKKRKRECQSSLSSSSFDADLPLRPCLDGMVLPATDTAGSSRRERGRGGHFVRSLARSDGFEGEGIGSREWDRRCGFFSRYGSVLHRTPYSIMTPKQRSLLHRRFIRLLRCRSCCPKCSLPSFIVCQNHKCSTVLCFFFFFGSDTSDWLEPLSRSGRALSSTFFSRLDFR